MVIHPEVFEWLLITNEGGRLCVPFPDDARIAIDQTVVGHVLPDEAVGGYRHMIANVNLARHHRAGINPHVVSESWLSTLADPDRHVLVEAKVAADALRHNNRRETVLHPQAPADVGRVNPASALSGQRHVEHVSPKERDAVVEYVAVIL